MLCGFPGEHEGNPLFLAASENVEIFKGTLEALEVSHGGVEARHHVVCHARVKGPVRSSLGNLVCC